MCMQTSDSQILFVKCMCMRKRLLLSCKYILIPTSLGLNTRHFSAPLSPLLPLHFSVSLTSDKMWPLTHLLYYYLFCVGARRRANLKWIIQSPLFFNNTWAEIWNLCHVLSILFYSNSFNLNHKVIRLMLLSSCYRWGNQGRQEM